MNLFLKKLINKLVIGGTTLLLIWLIASLYNWVASWNMNILITIGAVLLLVVVFECISDDSFDKWYRK